MTIVTGGSALADPTDSAVDKSIVELERDDTSLGNTLRIPIIAVENLLMILPPTLYYWNTGDQQAEDWELGWDWPTWRKKLTSTDLMVLDTNKFEANGMRHPLAGAMTYQIGRANGIGPIGSTIINFAASWVWEYVVEFREQVSFNDIVVNTTSGILIGEPLFQIGLAGDGKRASALRKMLGLATSPFHRVQKETSLSPLRDAPIEPTRLDLKFGTLFSTRDTRWSTEMQAGLELEVTRDRSFGKPGNVVAAASFAEWNQLSLDLRLDGDGMSGANFTSSTTYLGRTSRDVDFLGFGTHTFVGLGGGFEYAHRDVSLGRDRWTIFNLAGPRAGLWWRAPGASVAVEAGATADLGMVEAHAFTPGMLGEGEGILRLRGYYYSVGASAYSRVRAQVGRWSGSVGAIAHQFYSIDKQGSDDPTDVADQRATAKMDLGVTALDIRFAVYGDATVRRGTHQMTERVTTDVSTGVNLTVPF